VPGLCAERSRIDRCGDDPEIGQAVRVVAQDKKIDFTPAIW